ncbi:cordon-bleu WH2 repeat protein like 1 [Homo sapiens]|uniref:Cordon-bleu protein-like 1 n=3 Tax=Homo sapiens TaxID=9606 RepID=COBL1_HUMAN|nr:cordon-bleu protein-like 1 isoform 4 [Homo sapiens]NP_001352601.1 cordon-bleu protein-like 1 isoform 4 [Homo sapiens]NP_001352602.1 cordon-bleu protein-like 1 isoform 4 [Homo sapiens]Q53SF7.3 RecName: Full=Cordon-bleu protein-like 1 [Homo sapiens]KAI4036692.1 cordon-bleu WH2 repeat protein like 1 [Homo sapiens]KAI4036693.1 cordon-bleu WH2 repeat protein like 1 [Homo sapiens]|eukprot:NP_001265390.1 cordon-bleu protein-like 1 isoform 4 [Homo sapiens]
MDGRTPRPQDAPARRKPKAKAPLPPAETKYTDVSSAADSVESTAFIMEQKENMIDKDVELSVVLPGDIIKSTTVHGSKPMMDLLIFLCAQYHLNPSSYTIDLLSAEQNHIKFKPNTPIGMLEVEKVILKPKMLDKKKPTPIIPEKTVRVVINFKKTQKTIVRVSPHASLQELAPIICSKCEFDPLHTLLLKDYQSQEPLDLTKSLNDLGLRELYAMDVNRESCQISQNLDIMKEKENKGFFSFFQRSKKKRDQTASAPATPLVNKHRPTFTRSNTISKPYISNTLPSDAPKKRRAPLPPMPASQSVPQDLAHIQERPASCIVKSMSVDETDKSPCEAGRVRAGSLQLSSMSAGNSSLRRTKRKAPSPPSKIPPHQSDENSRVTALQPVDGVPPDSASEANSPEELSSPAGISSDYSLEEIDEKEELSEVPKVEAENISPKSQDIPFVSTDIINTLKNDPDSALGNGSGEFSQNSMEEKQETKSTDGQEPHSVVYDTSNGKKVVDSIRNLKSLGPNQENVVQNEIIVYPENTEDNMKNGVKKTEINVEGVAKNNNIDMEVERPSNSEAHETDTAISYKENHLAASSVPDQKLNQPSAEKTKDAAIQTTPSCNSFDGKHQDHNLSDSKVEECVQTSNNNISTQHSCLSSQDSVNTSREFRSQGTLIIHSEDPLTVKDPICAHGNDDLLPPVDRIDKNSTASYLKNYPLYRQDYNPKPKPSNEITREYIPKIGMTTYKIVPPKSLEISKDWQSETIEYKDDQDMHALGKKHTHENVKETAIQTEDSAISESPEEPLPNLKPKPNLRTEHQVPSSVSSPDDAMVSPLKPAPKMTRDTGTAPFAPNLEEINNILESKFKSRASNAQAKPSSFFLQMQKRVSGHYVTSAAAKSVHAAPNPAPKELTNKEAERDMLPSPEQTLSPLSKMPHSVPQPLVEKTDDDVIGQAPAEASPPPIAPKPVTIPASQVSTQNLKTLKTFGAPRPYSSSGPSPFALAVVKRSQSFSKERTESPSASALVQPPANTEEGKTHSVNKFVDIPQLGVSDKENNSAHNEQNSQIPTPTDGPSFTVMRQSSLTFQSSDPEQMRQSLLTAIRSGEAAAKLKRVTIPSNTISVNGRSRLSHSMSPDAQDGH